MIEFTPEKGIIQGNPDSITEATCQMKLDLFDRRDDTKAIHIYNTLTGENRFYVNYKGECYLSGTIEATAGSIAGWNIKKEGSIGVI